MFHGQVEGTGFVSYDKRFGSLYAGHVRIERLWSGARWCEGPAWFAAGRYLVWSDIPNNRMMRLVEPSHEVSVFREHSNNSNGNTVDNQGRLITCEHLSRRVTMTNWDGRIEVVADRYQGKRLNSPNDVVVKSDGSIWFTDPAYGIDAEYEGDKQAPEIGGCYVYRVDPASREVKAVVTDMVRPNGLAFSPDESHALHRRHRRDPQRRRAEAYPQVQASPPTAPRCRAARCSPTCTAGLFDGFRIDTEGRIWTSAGDGVHVYAADGTLLGKFLVPEIVANVTFGGTKRNRLYICGTTSIYSLFTFAKGSKTG